MFQKTLKVKLIFSVSCRKYDFQDVLNENFKHTMSEVMVEKGIIKENCYWDANIEEFRPFQQE